MTLLELIEKLRDELGGAVMGGRAGLTGQRYNDLLEEDLGGKAMGHRATVIALTRLQVDLALALNRTLEDLHLNYDFTLRGPSMRPRKFRAPKLNRLSAHPRNNG